MHVFKVIGPLLIMTRVAVAADRIETVDKLKGEYEALLDQARKTATEHGIDWPCWFDGQNGPIANDWNVLGWPTVYVLDQLGRIAAKNLYGESLEAKIQGLLEPAQ